MGRQRQWRRKHEILKNPNPKRSPILHEELIFLIASTGSCLLVSRFCKFCSVAVSTSHSIRAACERNWRNIRAELKEHSSSIGAVFEQNSRSLSSSIPASERQVLNCLSHDFDHIANKCLQGSCMDKIPDPKMRTKKFIFCHCKFQGENMAAWKEHGWVFSCALIP